MKAGTEALLQQCRGALLRQSDEHIAALLTQWFECMVGEESMDEEIDDLCLLLDYRVQSWGAQTSYGTYTSWWEAEGYLEPSEGMFICTNVPSLRLRLLDMPIKQFDTVIELAYQVRSIIAQLDGESSLPTGHPLLHEMIGWLENVVPAPEYLQRQQRSLPNPIESVEERREREQETIELACQQGYIVVLQDMPQTITNSFRHWCKEHAHPYICIENGEQQATLRVQAKTAQSHEFDRVLACFKEQLSVLIEPYIANAQARGYQASVTWIYRMQVVCEGMLVEDVEEAARAIAALWSNILVEEQQRTAEQEALRQAALVPLWQRALTRLREQEQPVELPLLAEKIVLPTEWDALFTREELLAFLAFLALPMRSREAKATLVQRVQERLASDRTAQALFFEVFKRELAVPPWELEILLKCTHTERKRWTEEGKLLVVEQRSFRKAGGEKLYPVFDRRFILSLSPTQIEQWRAEHQALVKEHRKKRVPQQQAL